MVSPHTEIRITNVIHGIGFILIQAVLVLALYKAFGIKPTGLGNSRWALSIVSTLMTAALMTSLQNQ